MVNATYWAKWESLNTAESLFSVAPGGPPFPATFDHPLPPWNALGLHVEWMGGLGLRPSSNNVGT